MKLESPVTIGMLLDILDGEHDDPVTGETIARSMPNAYGGTDRVVNLDVLRKALEGMLDNDDADFP